MKFGTEWKCVQHKFNLLEVIGEGSGGVVVKATHIKSNVEVAIKKIECSFDDLDHMKYVLREITIMR